MNNDPLNVYTTRVRSHQTDLNAAMYHGAYFDTFDDARIETFRRLGYTYQEAIEGGWNPVIRRLACEYYSPARMDELLRVTVLVPKVTPATLTIRYECRREDDILAVGHVVFAFVDSGGKIMRVPHGLRQVVCENQILAPEAQSTLSPKEKRRLARDASK